MGLKYVALLLQSNHLMPAAPGQDQLPLNSATGGKEPVFHPARDTGSSHQCRLVSTLGHVSFPCPPFFEIPSWCLYVDRLVQSFYIL